MGNIIGNLCIKGIFTSKLVNNSENLPLLTNYIECNDNYEDKQYNYKHILEKQKN